MESISQNKTRYNSIPSICLDFKRNRIRIYKSTLHMLSDPSAISIVIDPLNKIIGFGKCAQDEPDSVKVYPSHFESDNCYEVHSLKLMKKIYSLCDSFDINHSYRVSVFCQDKIGYTYFNLNSAVLISEVEE
ncbi:MAG: hypothetical protein IJ167_02660 [Lachnospiraceae bacterium]|nr:hypothetical protein [Lachnospiraceae bacterium]